MHITRVLTWSQGPHADTRMGLRAAEVQLEAHGLHISRSAFPHACTYDAHADMLCRYHTCTVSNPVQALHSACSWLCAHLRVPIPHAQLADCVFVSCQTQIPCSLKPPAHKPIGPSLVPACCVLHWRGMPTWRNCKTLLPGIRRSTRNPPRCAWGFYKADLNPTLPN